jgi:7-keto-8-aminopelargonate synthetase-like enzyme
MEAMEAMLERGWLLQAIRPPTVPVGTSRLRLSLSAALSAQDVDRLVEAVALMAAAGWFVPRGTLG